MTRRATAGIYYCNTPIHETDTAVELLASGTRTVGTASGSEVASDLIEEARALQIVLNLSASNTPTTLDVAVQAKIGNFWYNLLKFTQLGAVATAYVMAIVKREGVAYQAAEAETLIALDPACTGAYTNNQKFEWLNTLRVKYTVVGTSYTFSVTAYPIR